MSEQVEALLFERAGYLRRGLPDRVAEVDTQLAAAGYQEPVDPVAPVKRTAVPKGKRTTEQAD